MPTTDRVPVVDTLNCDEIAILLKRIAERLCELEEHAYLQNMAEKEDDLEWKYRHGVII